MLLNRERAAQVMERYELDALVATTAENIAYICEYGTEKLAHWWGGRRENYVLYPRSGQMAPALILASGTALSEAAQDAAADRLWIEDVRCTEGAVTYYRDAAAELTPELALFEQMLATAPRVPSPLEGLLAAIRDRGLERGRLGIDELHMPASRMKQLGGSLPAADLVDAYDIFREIRAVKTPEEVDRLRKAAKISQDAFEDAMSVVTEGVSERDIVLALRLGISRHGGIVVADSLGAGLRSALSAYATDYRIRRGDMIRSDFGAFYRFYQADISRMLVLGQASDKLARRFEAVTAGQQRAIQLLRPGVRAADVFETAVNEVRAAGIPDYKRNHVGHGIGMEAYDVPLMAPQDQTVLEAGMVVCIEVPYYEIGWGGINVEDTLLITPDGAEYLTTGGHELRVV